MRCEEADSVGDPSPRQPTDEARLRSREEFCGRVSRRSDPDIRWQSESIGTKCSLYHQYIVSGVIPIANAFDLTVLRCLSELGGRSRVCGRRGTRSLALVRACEVSGARGGWIRAGDGFAAAVFHRRAHVGGRGRGSTGGIGRRVAGGAAQTAVGGSAGGVDRRSPVAVGAANCGIFGS